MQAYIEWYNENYITNPVGYKDFHFLRFYECIIALNVESIIGFEDSDITKSGFSFSRDYEMLTVEICYLGKYKKHQ